MSTRVGPAGRTGRSGRTDRASRTGGARARVRLLVGAAVLAALVVALWADVDHTVLLSRLDGPVERAGVAARSPVLTRAVLVVTDAGSANGRAVLAALVVVPWALARRTLVPVLGALAALALAPLVTDTVKPLLGRPRPPAALAVVHPSTLSFPSGHATGSTALAVVLAGLVVRASARRWVRAVAVAAAVAYAGAVGASRIYLGAHWLTDVLAGWCAGAAVGLVILACLPRRRVNAS